MAAPRTTKFLDGSRIRAFRAAEDVLRADPVLADNVATWSTWSGEGNDAIPLTPGMMPYLQISPVVLPNEVMAVGREVAVLGVRITIAVAGLVAEDAMNFWDAVEDSFVKGKAHRDTTVFCFLQRHGCFAHRLVAPGIDAWRSRDHPPDQFLGGSGMLVLRISRPA